MVTPTLALVSLADLGSSFGPGVAAGLWGVLIKIPHGLDISDLPFPPTVRRLFWLRIQAN